MKRLLLLPLLVLPLLVLSCDQKPPTEPEAVPALGFEPSPFAPVAGVNQLYAQRNHLGDINGRITDVLGFEPTPFQPVVGQLNAMTNELGAINDRIVAVLGVEPTPFQPYFEPLVEIQAAAMEIADADENWDAIPPDGEEALFDALDGVRAAAGAIAVTAAAGLPAANADASFDVTAAGLVTNTLRIAVKCSAGVVGSAAYSLQPIGTSFGLACPAEARTHPAAGITGFRVGFFAIVNSPDNCDATVFFLAGGFPTRTKCTVNGRDVGGKPMATVVMKYVKD